MRQRTTTVHGTVQESLDVARDELRTHVDLHIGKVYEIHARMHLRTAGHKKRDIGVGAQRPQERHEIVDVGLVKRIDNDEEVC